MRHVILRHVALAAAVTTAAVPLSAQQSDSITIGEHWRAYLGCWSSSSAGVIGPMMCIVPTDTAEKVEMLVVVKDSVMSRVPVAASEVRVPLMRDGCTGWETARWSGDEHRLYTRGEFTCDGGAPQKSSGIYALTQEDAFSRIEGVTTKSGVRVRVVNYIRVGPAGVPLDVARLLLRANALPTLATRADAASPITFKDVSAALKEVDREVVEGWIADRGQRFALAPKSLRQLRADGVPTSVIDMMIAVSHPKVFTVQQGGPPMVAEAPARAVTAQCSMYDTACAMRFANRVNPRYDQRLDEAIMLMYGYGYGSMYLPYLRDYRDAFGYWMPYGGGYGGFNGYSLGGLYGSTYLGNNGFYGNGFFNNGWTNVGTPFVIVPTQPAPSPAGRATVVNGLGYTQQGASGGDFARPSPDVNGSGYSNGSGSSNGSSTGSGSAPSAGSGASTGGGDRTAKPRP